MASHAAQRRKIISRKKVTEKHGERGQNDTEIRELVVAVLDISCSVFVSVIFSRAMSHQRMRSLVAALEEERKMARPFTSLADRRSVLARVSEPSSPRKRLGGHAAVLELRVRVTLATCQYVPPISLKATRQALPPLRANRQLTALTTS